MPGIIAASVLVAVRWWGGLERKYAATNTRENVNSEKTKGRTKMNPIWEGKRKVGMAAKRRESEFATACEVAISGKVVRNVRTVVGAPRIRIGCIALRAENGA
jgi:hypothetical protein